MSYEAKDSYGQYVRLPGTSAAEAMGADDDPWAPRATSTSTSTTTIGDSFKGLLSALTSFGPSTTPTVQIAVMPGGVPMPVKRSLPIVPIAVVGGLGVAAYLLLRRKG